MASIVHSNTVKHGGQPNKNIGDAFLLVWRLSKSKEEFKKLKPVTQRAATMKRAITSDNNFDTLQEIDESLLHEASIIVDLSLLTVLKITT